MIQYAADETRALAAVTGRTPRTSRLDIVKQLLADLDTVTAPGLSFTMGKVVGLLREEVGLAETALSGFQRRVVRRALDDLAHEQDRLLPDADRFVARSQMITDTLALV